MTYQKPFIHIEQLGKIYAGPKSAVEVLKDLDLQVEAGESLAVVGASGVGKSTLLHILGTLDQPSSGKVYVDEQDVFSFDETSLAEFRNRSIGFVFQFHHLLPEFSALENVMMPGIIANKSKKEMKERAEKLLEQVEMIHRLGHRVGEMSGGEQQRVAVARALVMEPKLLLADEPTGNLDERTGEKVHELFVRLNQEMGLTTIVATHNHRLADALDRKVRLAQGKATTL